MSNPRPGLLHVLADRPLLAFAALTLGLVVTVVVGLYAKPLLPLAVAFQALLATVVLIRFQDESRWLKIGFLIVLLFALALVTVPYLGFLDRV